MLLGLPLLGAGVLGFVHTLQTVTPDGVYIAFLSALAIWGWIELALPLRRHHRPQPLRLPRARPLWERFVRAFGNHRLSRDPLAVATILMLAMAWDEPNRFGALTFAVLFVARISAKLNLFFGVANINTEFLPSTLSHLPSHFRRRPMNGFFPVSVTALCFAAGCWMERLVADHRARRRRGLHAAHRAHPSRPSGALVHGAPAARPETLALDDRSARAQDPRPRSSGLKETPNGL